MGGIKLEHWWIGMVVAGIAVLGSGAIAPDPRVTSAIGLGLLFLGIGEWMNHPSQTHIEPGFGGMWQFTGHPRQPTLVGNAFSFVGIVLLAGGAIRVGIALFQ